MNTKYFIGKNLNVTIDRKLGSKHPKWNFFTLQIMDIFLIL